MRPLRLLEGLTRTIRNGFAWPLGVDPRTLPPPIPGYAIDFTPSQDEDPDIYTYHLCLSFEQVAPVFRDALELLPESDLDAIVETSSFDDYRSVDDYISMEPVTRREFVDTIASNVDFFFEDGSIGIGLQSLEPFVEVFMDALKTITIKVPPSRCPEVEAILLAHQLEEQDEPWPGDQDEYAWNVRNVLDLDHKEAMGIDDILFDLRYVWNIELDVDPDANLDESGRELGFTLWRVTYLAEHVRQKERSAFIRLWLTASSFSMAEAMAVQAIEEGGIWDAVDLYVIERVAFDNRPDALADLAPRRTAGVHELKVESVEAEPTDDHA